MIRWLIYHNDVNQTSSTHLHPFFKNMMLLNKRGLDQPFWLGISHEAFVTFLAQANISLSNITSATLKTTFREMQRAVVPAELKIQLRRTLEAEGILDSKLELDLLISIPGESSVQLSWDSYCHISTKGIDGILQSIKACWSTIFRSAIFKKIMSYESDLSKINISIVVRECQNEILRGKAFSYSPRSPWDLRNSVVLYERGGEQYSFLVERSGFRSTFNGKKNDIVDELKSENTELKEEAKPSSKTSLRLTEIHQNFPHDKIKKVAEYLQHIEKILHQPIQYEWVMTADQRITIQRIQFFERTPSPNMNSPTFNTQTRNLWDQSLLGWDASALLKPLWFSLIPRNFRVLSIHYMRALGIKNKISPDYEKVFRGFWGLLRGRLYVNLGALHRYLGLGLQDELLEEIEVLASVWMKCYDREMREGWDLKWPALPLFSKGEMKGIDKTKQKMLSNWTDKVFIWVDKMHTLRESLVSSQWKEKNISTMLENFQQWERQYIPSLVPILLAELQYRNLMSWYYEGADKPSAIPSWSSHSDRKPIPLSGGWLERRRQEKRFQELEILSQLRPKYLSLLEDIYSKLRKFFELMGQKYRELGQLERADDIFYLTLEELLAFEEGRASTVSWAKLVEIRHEEYKKYAHDLKVSEVWMTTGLVGLASKFPDVIAISERKNPLFQQHQVMTETSIAVNKKTTKQINKQVENQNTEFEETLIKTPDAIEKIVASSQNLATLDFIEEADKDKIKSANTSSLEPQVATESTSTQGSESNL